LTSDGSFFSFFGILQMVVQFNEGWRNAERLAAFEEAEKRRIWNVARVFIPVDHHTEAVDGQSVNHSCARQSYREDKAERFTIHLHDLSIKQRTARCSTRADFELIF
jgi:hypothetical protein